MNLGDRVSLPVADGVRATGTVVGLPCDGRRVTVRLDSNTNVVYDVGVSRLSGPRSVVDPVKRR